MELNMNIDSAESSVYTAALDGRRINLTLRHKSFYGEGVDVPYSQVGGTDG